MTKHTLKGADVWVQIKVWVVRRWLRVLSADELRHELDRKVMDEAFDGLYRNMVKLALQHFKLAGVGAAPPKHKETK